MPTSVENTFETHPLISPAPTARLIQLSFVGLIVVASVILLILEPRLVREPTYVIAAVFILTGAVLAFLPLYDRPEFRAWMLLVPTLDFLAIATLRWDNAGGVTNPMVMMLTLPALWIGLSGLRSAFPVLIVGISAVMASDVVLIVETASEGATAQRTIMVLVIFPVAMLFAAGIANALARSLRERQEELQRQQVSRARASQEIENSRRLLETVLDSLDVGAVVMDHTGQPLLINRAIRESPLLRNGDERDPWDAFRTVASFEIDRVTPIAKDDTAVAHILRGEPVSDRLVWAGEDPQYQRALSVSAHDVHTAAGELLAKVIVVSDVTRLLTALESSNNFLAAVSHELRTPLTTMQGVVELLEEHPAIRPDEELTTWLDVMARNIRRQLRLVDDLLLIASSQRAEMAIVREDGDLSAVAETAVLGAQREAFQKGITVSRSGSEARGSFDVTRLGQVCDNLVTNAVRHSPRGSEVTVSTAVDGSELVLSVKDTGFGMTTHEIEHVFERFYRTASTRSSATTGTGLGLAIVRDIVEAHDGDVTIESVPGNGTTVTVRLPQ